MEANTVEVFQDPTPEIIRNIIDRQRAYFAAGYTKKVSFRIEQLKKLNKVIDAREADIIEALNKDFGKPPFETIATEIGIVKEEIEFAIKHLNYWARPYKVKSSLINYPSEDHIYSDPYGVVLIISPWNYPFQLIIGPLIAAIAAGNCAVLKPSEMTPHTSQVVEEIIYEIFDSEYIAIVQGGVETATSLLAEKFDHIFFTGSIKVGKIVMEAAAKHLTPVTLELGGKSPCIVDESAILDIAAKRIVWGKFVNAGQTCVAPDYLLVEESIKEAFKAKLVETISSFYGANPQDSKDFSRIINDRHFNKLTSYLEYGKIVTGGETDASERYIAPTIIDEVHWEDPLMQEEIFGPILPMITYKELNEAIYRITQLPKPLALYLFSEKSAVHKKVLTETSSGGVCINDTLSHYANPYLPFGGVGSSGMGNYHGKAGFLAFSHSKSVLKRSTWVDIALRYPPYKGKITWLKRAIKWT